MEHNRALGHQELHWKEFRFNLTQIPVGEEVTAAEFRIYKLPSTHPLNRTLHISMFEVVREQSNRCLLLTLPLVRPPSVCLAQAWVDISQRTEGELPGEHESPGTTEKGPASVPLSSPLPAILGVGPWTGH